MEGIGVLLNRLSGNRQSDELFASVIGKRIATVRLVDDALRFVMTDGTKFHILDDGQSCCESRYMRTDDDLESFDGATLLGAELRPAPEPDDYDPNYPHEVQFLAIQTDRGEFVMSSHVEHNGYYGGFSIRCVEG